jgi:3-deoxy-D-manno-octulosonate 8-phosphate phosphatase (KDO 8-P phosphatase)
MINKPAPSIGTLNNIEAIVFDCDGVLTDRGLFYDENGGRILRFDARDGFGIALWCRSGFKGSILSGRPIDIASKRFVELGMTELSGRCHDKREGLTKLCETWGVAPERVAFVGDDLPDLAAFCVAGLKIAVKDAAIEVQNSADWILHAAGGQGAAREVCETLLKARGTWQSWLEKHS